MSHAYTGQVERDPHGGLWAVLYRGNVTRTDAIVKQEPTRSVKRGMKRVEEMILSQVDADTQLIAPALAPAGPSAGRRTRPSPPPGTRPSPEADAVLSAGRPNTEGHVAALEPDCGPYDLEQLGWPLHRLTAR